MKEKIKNWIKKLGETIIVLSIVSVVFTSWVTQPDESYEGSFFKEFPKVFIFISLAFLIIWIVCKIYNAREPEIIKRDKFIDEIGEELENLEDYEKEDFEELKEEITNIRKEIDSFKS